MPSRILIATFGLSLVLFIRLVSGAHILSALSDATFLIGLVLLLLALSTRLIDGSRLPFLRRVKRGVGERKGGALTLPFSLVLILVGILLAILPS